MKTNLPVWNKVWLQTSACELSKTRKVRLFWSDQLPSPGWQTVQKSRLDLQCDMASLDAKKFYTWPTIFHRKLHNLQLYEKLWHFPWKVSLQALFPVCDQIKLWEKISIALMFFCRPQCLITKALTAITCWWLSLGLDWTWARSNKLWQIPKPWLIL